MRAEIAWAIAVLVAFLAGVVVGWYERGQP